MFQQQCCGVPTGIKHRYLFYTSPAIADYKLGYRSTCCTSAFCRWRVSTWPIHMARCVSLLHGVNAGLSFTRWAVEALTIEAYRVAAASMRPLGLYTLSNHGYCGLQRIVYWDVGAYISGDDAATLLALVQQGSDMCSTYVDHDFTAMAVQTCILCVVAAAYHSIQVYLTRKAVCGSFMQCP